MSASVIATLPSRTDTAAATQGVAKEIKKGNTLTGQYLYDKFIGNDKAGATFMEQVTQWSTTIDTASFATILKDFVTMTKEKHGDKSPQLATARTHRSNLQNIYGALRHAAPEFNKKMNGRTGYLVGKEIARACLKERNIKWDGSKVVTPEIREQKKATSHVMQAQEMVQDANPMNPGESYAAWQERIRPLVEAKIAEASKTEAEAQAEKLVTGIYERHPELARLVAAAILKREKLADNVENA